jgi:uncharacterized protein (TIGR03067 family)
MPFRILANVAVACTLFIALSVDAQGKDDLAKKELESIQGTWNFVLVEQAGVKQPRKKRGEELQTITFAKEKFEVKLGDKVVQSGTPKIEPGANPKFDLDITEGEGKGTMWLGIFELNGDTLKVCWDPTGRKRPTEFQSTAESGRHLNTMQRVRKAGVDPKDASVVYDEPFRMNSGFRAYNGRAYDVAALHVDPKAKFVIPETGTEVDRHDQADLLLICMVKRSFIRAHFVRSVSIADDRRTMGCAIKLDKGSLLIGTFGEYGFLEGATSMRLLILAPEKLELEKRAGLIGGYGGRAGSERPATAINPARGDPKPALMKSKEGKPVRWLPPTEEDGWHEIPAVTDVERRASKVEKK